LSVLLFVQFVEHIANLVIAAPFHRLFGHEQLLDYCSQRLGPIHDEQILAISGQAVIPQASE